jgi:hypothetical protein
MHILQLHAASAEGVGELKIAIGCVRSCARDPPWNLQQLRRRFAGTQVGAEVQLLSHAGSNRTRPGLGPSKFRMIFGGHGWGTIQDAGK